MSNQSAVKLTTSRYYTPLERSIQAKGIEPDILIKPLRFEEAQEKPGINISEASLQGHLTNTKDELEAKEQITSVLANEDYVLYEALNILKALAVSPRK